MTRTSSAYRLLTAAFLAAFASTASAQGYNAPAWDEEEWGGLYFGGQLTMFTALEGAAGRDGEGVMPGLHFGYRQVYGSVVLGAELEANAPGYNLANTNSIDYFVSPRVKLGYAIGPVMGNLILGAGYYGTNFGHMESLVAGIGMDFIAFGNTSIGIEALWQDITRHGSPNGRPLRTAEGEASTVSVRASYNF